MYKNRIYKLLLSLTFISLCSCKAVNDRPIIYELAAKTDNAIVQGLGIDENRSLIVEYSEPFTEGHLALEADTGAGAFKYQKQDNVIYDALTSLSIPQDIKANPRWEYKKISCHSNLQKNKYYISCSEKDHKWSYIYSKKRGILNFYYPCYSFEECNYREYKLITNLGVFSSHVLEKIDFK